MTDTRKIRWGIIGATARIAQSAVIPAILACENAELTAVASRSRERAEEIAGKIGPEVAAYGDYDSLIADANVDAVYLPLPNNLHLGWAVEAMNNGKHVLCEKPLALNAIEAEEMAETAEANGVILSEAFMYCYHPMQTEVAGLVRRGALGEVRLVRASFSYRQPEEEYSRRDLSMGGGALFEIGCYCLHIARQAFGTEPTVVTAKSLYDPQLGIDTTTTALMEFADGGMALIDCSFSQTQRVAYEIVGSSGSIYVSRFLLSSQVMGTGMEAGEYCLSQEGQTFLHQSPPGNMYLGEIDAMSRRIRGENVFLLPADDGVGNMRVLDAVATSARTGQKVIV